VFEPKWIEPLARVLGELGAQRAWVVHSDDGCDELTLGGANKVATLDNGKVEMIEITAADAGLKSAPLDDIRGGTPQENAQALNDLLDGKPGAYRDTVLLNAAAALIVAGRAKDLDAGVAQAAEAIDSGAARQKLDRLIAITTGQA
jgi:anthranilate phosphoribosyltransferase